jgi:hypothetical protein
MWLAGSCSSGGQTACPSFCLRKLVSPIDETGIGILTSAEVLNIVSHRAKARNTP